VAASGSDTCQAVLAFSTPSWTNPEVTRVITRRVTRGTGDVSNTRGMGDVSIVRQMMWQVDAWQYGG
jgi:hypothetical protein